ncbi:MAG: phage/plasmid primase, P4 family [Hyphomonas sp.]|nr:phage/plasmid primase, P4 family [Hyphomonas sp.]
MKSDIPKRIAVRPDVGKDLEAAQLPLTDLGNAERFRLRYGEEFRFCDKIGWFNWDGRRWRLLSEEKDALPAEVMQAVFATVRAIRNEAALIAALGCDEPEDLDGQKLENWRVWASARRDEGLAELDAALRSAFPPGPDGLPSTDSERAAEEAAQFIIHCSVRDLPTDTGAGRRKLWSGAIAAWAKASESNGKLGSIAKIARSFPGIAIEPDQLDRDRMAINVFNGTLRLKRRSVKRSLEEIAAGKSEWKVDGWKIVRDPHRREDLITKLARVNYVPSASSPNWDAFMLQVQPDPIMRRFIHQWFGLSLTGDIGDQKMAFFYGSGRNGKGTAVEAVAHLAGDYAGSIPIESFLDNGMKRRGDQATPDLARLPGVRFLRVSEPERGARLNEGLVKMVTGGDPVDARHLNKGFFTFLPDFKMTISGNHKPEIKDTSDGIWRRMQLVPWGVTVPTATVDRDLPAKLNAEASGILNRVLEGLCDWREHGLIEPDEVRMATAAYRDQSDELGRFLSDTCEVGEDVPQRPMRVPAKLLHDTYLAWCEHAGGSHWKIGGFKKGMQDKGFLQKASDGMKWLGIRLRDGIDPEAIREGRWSGPDAAGPAGVVNSQKSAPKWPIGDDPNWVPGDD